VSGVGVQGIKHGAWGLSNSEVGMRNAENKRPNPQIVIRNISLFSVQVSRQRFGELRRGTQGSKVQGFKIF
jgi:hypothetical protein